MIMQKHTNIDNKKHRTTDVVYTKFQNLKTSYSHKIFKNKLEILKLVRAVTFLTYNRNVSTSTPGWVTEYPD
jgi:hypothetical protein